MIFLFLRSNLETSRALSGYIFNFVLGLPSFLIILSSIKLSPTCLHCNICDHYFFVCQFVADFLYLLCSHPIFSAFLIVNEWSEFVWKGFCFGELLLVFSVISEGNHHLLLYPLPPRCDFHLSSLIFSGTFNPGP